MEMFSFTASVLISNGTLMGPRGPPCPSDPFPGWGMPLSIPLHSQEQSSTVPFRGSSAHVQWMMLEVGQKLTFISSLQQFSWSRRRF
ncbi:hypothetical protein CDAR_75921 [Caerostris darwini]|uniref:Uncharacterized protein n=1 Tax=Caerostris darwini TaxID=1538125 RepID=A0AAV4P2P6_9ARAC|nr:hypothetical protein CDAR_75921 [Caerostris darwini]